MNSYSTKSHLIGCVCSIILGATLSTLVFNKDQQKNVQSPISERIKKQDTNYSRSYNLDSSTATERHSPLREFKDLVYKLKKKGSFAQIRQLVELIQNENNPDRLEKMSKEIDAISSSCARLELQISLAKKWVIKDEKKTISWFLNLHDNTEKIFIGEAMVLSMALIDPERAIARIPLIADDKIADHYKQKAFIQWLNDDPKEALKKGLNLRENSSNSTLSSVIERASFLDPKNTVKYLVSQEAPLDTLRLALANWIQDEADQAHQWVNNSIELENAIPGYRDSIIEMANSIVENSHNKNPPNRFTQ